MPGPGRTGQEQQRLGGRPRGQPGAWSPLLGVSTCAPTCAAGPGLSRSPTLDAAAFFARLPPSPGRRACAWSVPTLPSCLAAPEALPALRASPGRVGRVRSPSSLLGRWEDAWLLQPGQLSASCARLLTGQLPMSHPARFLQQPRQGEVRPFKTDVSVVFRIFVGSSQVVIVVLFQNIPPAPK